MNTEWALCIHGSTHTVQPVKPPCWIARWMVRVFTGGVVKFVKMPEIRTDIGVFVENDFCCGGEQ